MILKLALFLFKEATATSLSSHLPLLRFEGAEAEDPWSEIVPVPQVPSPGTDKRSLFNYTSQLGSVTRGFQKNPLRARSQQNRRALPTLSIISHDIWLERRGKKKE